MGWGSMMNARPIQDHKTIVSETFVQPPDYGNSVASPLQENTMANSEMGTDCVLDSAGVEKQRRNPFDNAFSLGKVSRFMGSAHQIELRAQSQSPRIAFKVKGRIIFMDLGE